LSFYYQWVLIMPNPFFYLLKKEHVVEMMTSTTDTKETNSLTLLLESGDTGGYQKKLEEYAEEGKTFRLTKGKVYETTYEGETLKLRVALQVKGHSLTWYFWAPGAMDQYPQEFRDKLYNAAAAAHKQVKDGCDLYYRGSNAVHIKLMHDLESESNHNHNHYRLRNNKAYTPEDFNQHLDALAKSEIHSEFFEEGEIEEICGAFKSFYEDWILQKEGKPFIRRSTRTLSY
jgi:hypothetical protein